MIKKRKRGQYKEILTKDFLYQEYVVNGLSSKEIANIVGCCRSHVEKTLKTHDIPSKQSIKSKLVNKRLTKQFLINQYVTNKLSARLIADIVGCNTNYVYILLKKYNIDTKRKKILLSEARNDTYELWDYEKNEGKTPDDFYFGSNRKVWLNCLNGHSYQQMVGKISNGNNCPYCVNQKVSPENSLATQNPLLATEWDYNKNNNISPTTIAPYSNKKYWWVCRFCKQSWMAKVSDRHGGKTGCPHCRISKLERVTIDTLKDLGII